MEEDMVWLLSKAKRLGIQVKESKFRAPSNEIYPLENKIGCALILSNPFIGHVEYERRKASEADAKMMQDLWESEIGCELFDIGAVDANIDQQTGKAFDQAKIDLRNDIAARNPNKTYEKLTAEEMKELLKSLAETKKKYDYIVVVISTHGAMVSEEWLQKVELGSNSARNANAFRKYRDERSKQRGTNAATATTKPMASVFLGEDFVPVREAEIMELFYNDRSFNLRGIPKFFILDYCRGDGGANDKLENIEQTKGGYNGDGPHKERQVGWPQMSDTVTIYATHRNYVAYNGSRGSKLISTIKQVFSEHCKNSDIMDLLTKVNKEVEKKCVNTVAMSIFESSLVKQFNLFPQRSDQA